MLAVVPILDYGAMCSGLLGEVALAIISQALDCVKEEKCWREDPVYPDAQVYGRSENRWSRFESFHRGRLRLCAQGGIRIRGKDIGRTGISTSRCFHAELATSRGAPLGSQCWTQKPYGLGHVVHQSGSRSWGCPCAGWSSSEVTRTSRRSPTNSRRTGRVVTSRTRLGLYREGNISLKSDGVDSCGMRTDWKGRR